ncbi:MAG: response regulator [Oscillospiraceae bacterium]|jgi:putative two-component system response regulator|nr:response regulator [Oscillospiraceae bacterium]
MKTIFIVDDSEVNLFVAEEILSKQYRVYTLTSAAGMFELLKKVVPDLILLDILMPETSGLEAMKALKDDFRYSGVPIVFLTGRNDSDTEVLGFEMGAVDFIPKPFSGPVLLNRIKTHLRIDDMIRERTANLKRLKDSIVTVLANMVENRDTVTGKHIERTTMYIKILMEAMLERGVYSDELSRWDLETVASSARLHDVGKIVISDLILNKPGKLTPEEFSVIETHASEGERIIDSIIAESGDEDFLRNAKLFAGYHHEYWDGNGYPRGLSGTKIPLQGRLMAIVDVYDALRSVRPYKAALSHEESVNIISKNRGRQFDPSIVDVFVEINEAFEKASL